MSVNINICWIELFDTAEVTINILPKTTPPTEPTTPTPTTQTPTPTPMMTINPIETSEPLALPDTTTSSTNAPTTVPTIKVEPQETPKAGEKAPLWPIGLALLLIAGGLTFILHRKEEKDQQ